MTLPFARAALGCWTRADRFTCVLRHVPLPSYVPVIQYLHKQRGVPAPQESNRRAGALDGVRGTGANASRDFRQMVFFAAMVMHSHKFHTRFIFLIREHNACLEKGDKMLCLLELGVLPIFQSGRGSPARYFDGILLVAPDSPSPSACTHRSLVWSTMAFDPTAGKTPRT